MLLVIETSTVPGALGGSFGRTGQALIVHGAWVHFGWHYQNESASLDSRTPLKLRPRQRPGVRRNMLLSLLMTPDMGKDIPQGSGGEGLLGIWRRFLA